MDSGVEVVTKRHPEFLKPEQSHSRTGAATGHHFKNNRAAEMQSRATAHSSLRANQKQECA